MKWGPLSTSGGMSNARSCSVNYTGVLRSNLYFLSYPLGNFTTARFPLAARTHHDMRRQQHGA